MASSKKKSRVIDTRELESETPNPTPPEHSVRWIPNPEEEDYQLSFEQFSRDIREDPEGCYQQLTSLRTMVVRARDQNQDDQVLIVDLQRQVEELSQENQDHLKSISLLIRQNRNPGPSQASRNSSVNPESSRSTKFPDPPMLSDGKNPRFEDWYTKIKHKLQANSDHYPDEQSKIAYIYSRTEGDAAQHLFPRMRDDATPFSSVQDVYDLLKSIYLDPNHVRNARAEFRGLRMRKDEPFQEFHTRFLHLAQEAQISRIEWRDELIEKLRFDLQKAVLPQFHNLSTFQELTDCCRTVDQGLQRIYRVEERSRHRVTASNAPSSKKDQMKPADPPTTSRTQNTNTNRLTRAETPNVEANPNKEQLMKEGRCFYCKESGHMISGCPKRKSQVNKVQELGARQDQETESEN
jgi:hypothetical protein